LGETATGIRDGLAVRCARYPDVGRICARHGFNTLCCERVAFLDAPWNTCSARLPPPGELRCPILASNKFRAAGCIAENLVAQVKPSVCTQHGRHLGTLRATCSHEKTRKKGLYSIVGRRNHIGKYPLINSRRI
jgi:hypothetical protein